MMQGSQVRCTPKFVHLHYRYTGKERDAESGLDYFGARYYASSMGRWMSPDWSAQEEPVPYAKLDNPQSLNLYGYVLNNPLSKADPDGHCPECVAQALEEYGQPLEDAISDAVRTYGPTVVSAVGAFGSGVLTDLSGSVSPVAGIPNSINGQYTPATAMNANGEAPVPSPSPSPSSNSATPSGPQGPYKRPNNATTKDQRALVQGKPCATCGAVGQKNNADHKDPLVEQHYRGGIKPDNSPNAVRPQCSRCSAQQGGYLKQFSTAMKRLFGFTSVVTDGK